MTALNLSRDAELIRRLTGGDELTVTQVAEFREVDERTALRDLCREARCWGLQLVDGVWRYNPAAWERLPSGFPLVEYVMVDVRQHVVGVWPPECWCEAVRGIDWTYSVVHRDPVAGLVWPPADAVSAGWRVVVAGSWPSPTPLPGESPVDGGAGLDALDLATPAAGRE